MSRDDDPAALQWIRSQAAKGAIVIGVCVGAKVIGDAGLLDSKRATWYSVKELRGKHPTMRAMSKTGGSWSTAVSRLRPVFRPRCRCR